jgi:hypothetical protein
LSFFEGPFGLLDTQLLCDRFHLIAQLRVVFHHLLPKLFDVIAGRLLLCQLSQLYLGSAAFEGLF